MIDVWSVADLCDAHSSHVNVVPPILSHFGGVRHFMGQATTVCVDTENSVVLKCLGNDGLGRVLVVSGKGDASEAIVGDRLAELAIRNSWRGLIVDGAVRDTAALARMEIGVMARRVFPRRGEGGSLGVAGVPIKIGGVRIEPGDWIYADLDGILVSRTSLL